MAIPRVKRHLLLRTGSAAWGGFAFSEGVELEPGVVSVRGRAPGRERSERSGAGAPSG